MCLPDLLTEVKRSEALFAEATRYAREAGWILDTSMAHYGVLPEHWRGDGVITILLSERGDITRFMSRQKVPVVALYADAPHVQVPRVALDDVRIGQLAAEHFLERGFTDLGFYRFTDLQEVQDREAGFRRTVQQAGRNFHLLDWHGAARQGRRLSWFDWLQRELAKLPLPMAIMAQSDHRATYLLSACEAAGLAVPEQVALIGVDNDEMICELTTPPLSSIEQGSRQIGYQAASLLDRLMAGRAPRPARHVIPPESLIARQSTDVLAGHDAQLAQAIRFVREHACDPISVGDVLRLIPLSRSTLENRFRVSLGRTIHAEIQRVQVEQARQLLMHTDLLIKQIAVRCGFKYVPYLTRVFRQHVGLSPGEYRRRYRSGRDTASE